MKRKFTISVNQINSQPGDFKGNTERLIQSIENAKSLESELLIFPAQSITGMSWNSLFKKDHFRQGAKDVLEKLSKYLTDHALKILIPCPVHFRKKRESVFLISADGIHEMSKEGKSTFMINRQSIRIFEGEYENEFHIKQHDYTPNTLLINFNTTPFYTGIQTDRESMGRFVAEQTGNRFLEVNPVGTTDHLVFYGSSFLIDHEGNTLMRAKSFKENFITLDIHAQGKTDCIYGLPEKTAANYEAITQSIRDYLHKNSFRKVLLGLSGGIDSALVTTLAVEALGSDNVFGLLMPSQFSSQGSLDDAQKLAENLGIKTAQIPITSVYHCLSDAMSDFFGERTFNTTDENMQARIRGLYLMAVSNEYGYVVLNTGNKSETATGYSTLYGDTIGGYAPISDLYKTDCYKLAAFINMRKGYNHIPKEILEKAPSAELAPGQTDQDSLPPYEVLDGILGCILEQNLSIQEIVGQGYPEEAVKKTAQLLRINEYKRRQEPMGPRLSKSSFVHDLNLPVTNGFKG